jgi:adenosine deaminase CECR1
MVLSDELWEEISQDVPSASDPFIQQYLNGRANLISQEKASRADASFRANLSPIAKRACEIVERIKAHERDTIWTPGVEEELARSTTDTIFPGMMFRFAKDRMEGTKLWKIVRQMPKGCLLHAHMDATVNFDFILGELMALPGIHMSSDRSLDSSQARENAALSFRYKATDRTDGSVWTAQYRPDTYLRLTKIADEFPEGGREGFLKWLKSRCTLSVEDSQEQHHGVDHIWRKFVKCFMVADTIIHYEPIFRVFLRRLMRELKADGVNWAELRYVSPGGPAIVKTHTVPG